ncbi:hypothetical protein ACIPY3_08820 [Paenarthrobacter sp. NPDC089714]|uniref:hypothetical protein n=1 Tax=Paenarthrobacter sp. NPDC089714 TaxID=3364377 RepID=UPI003811B971
MNGDTNTTSGPSAKKNNSGDKAFLPLGIVFAVLGVTLMILGNPGWIAFATMGATFLILGLTRRGTKQPPETPRD